MALDIGETIRLSAAFTNLDGDPADPTTVTLQIRDPSGNNQTVQQASLSNPAVGTWHYDFEPDEAGTWTFRFEGTGALDVIEEALFTVVASAFA